ncbi:gamma-glutamyl-gamma-aminobutyrate hydrolase family protein [Sporosarcina sp. FA9]|uniref:gamma-glutamyl-gamma-aminobutyrate hydrolase family protein n=1 Tax=Sporosarcina sp. FA9 TaxID=3413030 RepID=UPI003F659A58
MSRPIIGVNCNFKPHLGEQGTFNLDRAYTQAVYDTGGIPQIIPLLPIKEVEQLLDLYDGLLLTGGGGLLPHIKEMDALPGLSDQNPMRHEFDLELVKVATKKGMPILGLCRGHQTINDANGGSIMNLNSNKHLQKEKGNHVHHEIIVEPNSKLYECVEAVRIGVNSFHSQVIDKPGEGLSISSYSADGFVESIESEGESFIVGVQFHPEFMMENKAMSGIYESFIEASNVYKARKL